MSDNDSTYTSRTRGGREEMLPGSASRGLDEVTINMEGMANEDENATNGSDTAHLLMKKPVIAGRKRMNTDEGIELAAPRKGDSLMNDVASERDVKAANTAYVEPSTVAFWLSMWFVQNIGITFWNKKALSTIRLPVTLTFVHMLCNSLGAYLFIHAYKGVERKPLDRSQKRLMFYFSIIFVSNIVTGNWSLGLVSISFNQVMRALVPGVVVVLSIIILAKSYSTKRKLSLIPVAIGVYLACSGDNSCTMLGFIITSIAVVFAGLKAVLSSKFLTGDLKLHPVDLILHQAPLSAMWCLMAMLLSGEAVTLLQQWYKLPSLCFWYFVTGIISFLLNVTSFYANKVTSPVTLSVCANMKQIMVIAMSIWINDDSFGMQKGFGILIVTIGGALYAYISNREMVKGTPIRPQQQQK